MSLKFDAMLPAQPLRQVAELGRRAAAAGLSGLVVTEAGRTAYLTCGALAVAADIDVLTGIAVAFPRSPMVTAATAWELTEATGGRFRLGLGAQVRSHVLRRYGSEFDPPGPRLREYVVAVKQIFESFRTGEPLAVEGEFYALSLLPPTWSPGAIGYPDPPVDVAAVNPWMLRMAGQVADGLHVHPLNNPTYLRETVLPELDAGARRSGRTVDDLEVIVPAFLCVGDTEQERQAWREMARVQVAFYGSTPNYAFIFEQLDREGTTERIRERQRAGDVAGMAAVIDDDLLEQFTTTGTWDDVADEIVAKYGGIATRVVSYFAGSDLVRDPERVRTLGDVGPPGGGRRLTPRATPGGDGRRRGPWSYDRRRKKPLLGGSSGSSISSGSSADKAASRSANAAASSSSSSSSAPEDPASSASMSSVVASSS